MAVRHTVYYPPPKSGFVDFVLLNGNFVPAAAVTSWLPVGTGLNSTGGYCINPSFAAPWIDTSFALRVPTSKVSDHTSEQSRDDSVSCRKKVKFLCRFGGKIVSRPSDEGLRYVGGHTKIISVRRDMGYSELVQKMAEVYGQNSNVIIKYQLPDMDLDALVSVSGQDDLENMMDEYDKLVERSSADRIAKLRVFLFSASELDSYVEAMSGIDDAVNEGGLVRAESIASATSTQSLESSGAESVVSVGRDLVDASGPPSTSSSGFLPRGNPAIAQELVPAVKSVSPPALSVQLEHELERCVPLSVTVQQQQQQIVYNSPPEYVVQINPSQMAPYPTQILSNIGWMFIQQQFQDNIRAMMPLNRKPVAVVTTSMIFV